HWTRRATHRATWRSPSPRAPEASRPRPEILPAGTPTTSAPRLSSCPVAFRIPRRRASAHRRHHRGAREHGGRGGEDHEAADLRAGEAARLVAPVRDAVADLPVQFRAGRPSRVRGVGRMRGRHGRPVFQIVHPGKDGWGPSAQYSKRLKPVPASVGSAPSTYSYRPTASTMPHMRAASSGLRTSYATPWTLSSGPWYMPCFQSGSSP